MFLLHCLFVDFMYLIVWIFLRNISANHSYVWGSTRIKEKEMGIILIKQENVFVH